MTDKQFFKGCKECEHSNEDGYITGYCLRNCEKLVRQNGRWAAQDFYLTLFIYIAIAFIGAFILSLVLVWITFFLVRHGIISS